MDEDYPADAPNVGAYSGQLEKSILRDLHYPRLPIRKKLNIRIKQRKEELKELEDALAALDSNAEFEKLHDTLTRVSRFL